jgi:hypothetical protein
MKLFIVNKGGMMKIVVTRTNKKKQSFEVSVVDGLNPIYKELVSGIKNRDEVVWKLADLYGAVDIEIIEPKAREFKFSEIPNIPVLDEEEAEEYFEDCIESVYDRIVTAIKEGVHTKRATVRLFELNSTGVYLTSERSNWKVGLEQIIQHYIRIEAYEKCTAVHKLIEKI